MKEIDPIEKWLGAVAYSNSGSKKTENKYRTEFENFLKFIGKTAKEIIAEYRSLTDFRDVLRFKDQLADFIESWIFHLKKQGLANLTIAGKVCSVKSFLKYNRIYIGYIPTAKSCVEYHNRDIKKTEIEIILNVSLPRDRAFYVIAAQSGLRPSTICKLQRKHIEYDRFLRDESPVKIEIPQNVAKGKYQSYFTFMGDESIKHLKSYLKKRGSLSKESYLFVKQGTKNEKMRPSAFSAQFNKTVRKLHEKGVLDFEIRKNKPAELRLYSLRKFFRKFASQAGHDYVNFWLGHTSSLGVDLHYLTKDTEFHRKLYMEKAAPHLRIEKITPTQTEELVENMRLEFHERLQKKDIEIQQIRKEMKELKEKTKELQAFADFIDKHDLLSKNKTLKAVIEILAGSNNEPNKDSENAAKKEERE